MEKLNEMTAKGLTRRLIFGKNFEEIKGFVTALDFLVFFL